MAVKTNMIYDRLSLEVIEAEQTFGVDYDYYYFKLRGIIFPLYAK